MVAYLKAGLQVRTYSNYLRAAQEVEKEDSMELSHSQRTQVTYNAPKPWPTSFFPLWKLKGNQQTQKCQLCDWGTWRKKALEEMRTKGTMIQTESMGLLRN